MSIIELTKDIQVQFEESVDESGSFGTLIIKGINFPDDDILPKFASSWRKRTFEKYSIRASATFNYNYKESVPYTKCFFYLDYIGIDTETDRRSLEERFSNFFPQLVSLFEEIVEIFLFDFEDGYVPYSKYIETGTADREIADRMLDNFLRKFNFKTPSDDENKQKFQKGIKDLIERLNYNPYKSKVVVRDESDKQD